MCNNMWSKVESVMPCQLRNELRNMSPRDRTIMILSCYKSNFIPEWIELFSETARYITYVYKVRCELYDNQPENDRQGIG